VSHLSRPQGHLPGQPKTNPKGQMNAITLRSGRELESPPMPMRKERRETDNAGDVDKEVPFEIPNEWVHIEMTQEVRIEHVSPSAKLHKPLVPYHQRLVNAKKDYKYWKLLEILKKFHTNIPVLEAITDMPYYAKFLKDLLSNKGTLLKNATVALTEEYSTIIQNKLLPMLSDLGSFCITCSVGDVAISRALYDLGASMGLKPYSIYKRLQVGELEPTTISLQLADTSVKYP